MLPNVQAHTARGCPDRRLQTGIRGGRWSVCAVFALVLISGSVAAATIEQLEFEQVDDHYVVSMQIELAVSAANAYAVMTDFERLPQLNPSVLKAEMRTPNRLQTVVSLCVLFFCRDIHQVQTVTMPGGFRVHMRVIPDKSDLKYGTASWHFLPLEAQRSRLIFRAELAPDFWLPPLIGPWLLKNKVKTETLQTCESIERFVRTRDP